MARLAGVSHLVALFFSTAVVVSAQTTGSTPQSTTASPTTASTASVTSSAASSTITASTSSDIPLSLWAIANSLLTSYYPSTSLTAIDTLTFPSVVVIGSSTYTQSPAATGATTTSVLAAQTGSSKSNSSHGLSSDAKLGVIIGVVIGVVVFAFLGLLLCCLRRRRKSTGSLFLRRPTPSVTDSDIGTWRTPRHPDAPPRQSRDWLDSYNRLPEQAAPPMAMHPAYVRHHSSRSTSEENPFFTPQERSDAQLGHYETDGIPMYHKELDASDESQRLSPSDGERRSRPLTPFAPTMMMGNGMQQPQGERNPFSSPEDDEADDVISPIIPARSPERRHSPMVHYPSWSEVSEFDFSGDGRGRHSVNDHSGSEEGGDGYRPRRESIIGRHELA